MRILVAVDSAASVAPASATWGAVITAAGHEPVVRSAGASGLLTGVDAAVLDGSVNADDLPAGVATAAIPMVVTAGRASSTTWRKTGVCSAIGGTSSTTIWTAQSGGNALLAGLSGNFAPWASGVTKHSATPVAGSTLLAVVNAGATRGCYWLVPEGTPLADGLGNAPALRIAVAQDATATMSTAYGQLQAAMVEALVAAAVPVPVAARAPRVRVWHTPPLLTPADDGTVTLDSQVVTEPGAPATSLAWTPVGDAPALASGASTDTATVDLDGADPGTYVYQLAITSTAGTATAQVQVYVTDEVPGLYWWDGTQRQPRDRVLYQPDETFHDLETGELVPNPLTGAPPPVTVGLVVADDDAVAPAVPAPNPNNGDLWVKARLEAAGYSVTYVADSQATSPGAFDCLFVSPSSNSTASVAHRPFTGPILLSLGSAFDDFQLAAGAINSASHATVNVVGSAHPIAAGLSAGVRTIFTAATAIRVSLGALGTPVLDRDDPTPSQRVLTAVETGTLNTVGVAAPARRVLMGFDGAVYNSGGSTRLNADGLAIFDAAALWCFGTPA